MRTFRTSAERRTAAIVRTGIVGLLVGFVMATGLPAVFAACELGCQESEWWRALNDDETATFCYVYDGEQGMDGRVAGDIGTLTKLGDEKIKVWPCPSDECLVNCPSTFTVPHQSAGQPVNQGCGMAGEEELYHCHNP